jgi:hypothetical protein
MRGSQDQAETYSVGSAGRSAFDAFGEWMSSRWHIGVIPARPAPMALHTPWRVPTAPVVIACRPSTGPQRAPELAAMPPIRFRRSTCTHRTAPHRIGIGIGWRRTQRSCARTLPTAERRTAATTACVRACVRAHAVRAGGAAAVRASLMRVLRRCAAVGAGGWVPFWMRTSGTAPVWSCCALGVSGTTASALSSSSSPSSSSSSSLSSSPARRSSRSSAPHAPPRMQAIGPPAARSTLGTDPHRA